MKFYHPENRPLFRAALVTTPIIMLMLLTPVFLTVHATYNKFVFQGLFIALPMITLGIFISWMIHISLIGRLPENKQWYRYFIASGIMIIVSTGVYYIIREFVPLLHDWTFQIMRIVNIFALNAIIYVISNYVMLLQTKRKLDLENEELRFANLEAQYKLLNNQINPHFLFNSLGNLKSLIKRDPDKADEYLVKLSSFLRLGLDSRPADAVSVSDELLLCNDYIALQQLRFGEALTFESAISDQCLSCKIPYFALLTLVENAVKHNSMSIEHPLKIVIRNSGEFLTVSNNFREKFNLETSAKTGLPNLSERYRLLFDQPVVIEKTTASFSVTIKMMNP